jgi:enamine deaminase RidA (YjgF/YER057c/UK114 family)
MIHPIVQRLENLGIVLPEPSPVAGNYVPFVVAGPLLSVSGQLPVKEGGLIVQGQLGKTISEQEAYDTSRLCGLHVLGQVRAALHGHWSRLLRCVQLSVFVSASPEFVNHPAVANGASDLMVEVLGPEIGRHARAAVGCSSLPKGAAVEVGATFWIED